MQVVCQLSHNKNKLRLAQGQATFESSFSELQAGISFFFPFFSFVSPENHTLWCAAYNKGVPPLGSRSLLP